MRSRWFSVRATDIKHAVSGGPVCVRLGGLGGVFKAQCARHDVSVSDEIRDIVARILKNPEALNVKAPQEDERIRVSLGPLKSDFTRWCKSRGLTVSAALRLLVAQTLEQLILNEKSLQLESASTGAEYDSASTPGQAIVGVQELAHEPSRLRLRLKQSELEAVSHLAEQRRVSPQRLVTQVLRAFLLKAAVFSDKETVDMGSINLSLMRIGNNLNQIAKQLNAQAASIARPGEGAYADFEATNLEVRRCVTELDQYVRVCAHALALSRERWRIELKD